MKERPILFSGEMVRAILDGRKSQTRRVMKWQPDEDGVVTVGEIGSSRGVAYIGNSTCGGIRNRVPCPYGQPGDRLWAREAWRTVAEADSLPPRNLNAAHRIWREADAPHQPGFGKYRPPMFMPRWVSRITLEITGVRVERVQEISHEDAQAEGLSWVSPTFGVPGIASSWNGDSRLSFAALWESINAARGYGWEVNPWVWVIEFRRMS